MWAPGRQTSPRAVKPSVQIMLWPTLSPSAVSAGPLLLARLAPMRESCPPM